jgi:hypothetical protein
MTTATIAKGTGTMALKAPGIVTFLVSIIIVVAVVMIKFAGASVPLLNGHEFWGLMVAHALLVGGCLLRSM